jgi:nucleotide-binding universal stress UspA family protein
MLLASLRDRLSLQKEFVEAGMPAPTIVKKAKEWSADIIVIASHGLGCYITQVSDMGTVGI